VLGQAQRVQEQTNLLNLLPTRKQSQEANLDLKKAQLEQAKLDLEHTEIPAPFDCRLGEVELELDQYVVAGEKLFEAYSIDLAEVEAQVLPIDVRRLFQQSEAPAFVAGISMERLREIFKVKAMVEMASTDISARWPAKFMRVRESLDPHTRTIGLVVGVEKPYENVIPGRRPPLLAGAYCRVTFTGPTRDGQIIVPRSAIRDGHVFVLDAENRLRQKSVRVDFVQDEFAVVGEGLAGGETLVVSNPTPAIVGMLVEPLDDPVLLKRLIDDAKPAAEQAGAVKVSQEASSAARLLGSSRAAFETNDAPIPGASR
jgi:RND family efflux transporter MFP subunit